MEHSNLIAQIALCIGFAWLLGALALRLRQPVILGYLAAGVVLGPQMLGLVDTDDSLKAISEIGLSLLLFLIGLEIDLKRVAAMGRVLTVTAVIQILGCTAVGVAVFVAAGYGLGGGRLDALYLGFAASLSSTVIVVKLLAERAEIDTLPGRLTIGVLVFQDLAAVLFVGLQPTLLNPGLAPVLLTFLKIGLLVAGALLLSRHVLPRVFGFVANLPELVVIGSLAWAFSLAAAAEALHLSREMGALIAGVAISTYPYSLDVEAKVASLRDLFVTLFFVLLGVGLAKPSAATLGIALLIIVVVVFTRLLTVMPPVFLLGQSRRAGFLTAVNLMQVSEFSLVLVSLGVGLKHLDQAAAAPVFVAFALTAVLSSYAIPGADRLFQFAAPMLDRLGLRDRTGHSTIDSSLEGEPDIYLLGLYREGSSLLEEISRHEPELLPRLKILDFNPNTYYALRRRQLRVTYGDIGQRDVLVHAGLPNARIILIPLAASVLRGVPLDRLLRNARALNPRAIIIVIAEQLAEVAALRAAGADHVVAPRLLVAAELLSVLRAADGELLGQKRAELDRALADRDEVIP
ncbi:MAG: cation:proton antiporter [Limisphaerales bacterium]